MAHRQLKDGSEVLEDREYREYLGEDLDEEKREAEEREEYLKLQKRLEK